MWTNETLEAKMDVEKGHIPQGGLTNHGTFQITHYLTTWMEKSNLGIWGQDVCMFIEKKDVSMIVWKLVMQKCGLSISLQQPKMKVAKLTQTKVV